MGIPTVPAFLRSLAGLWLVATMSLCLSAQAAPLAVDRNPTLQEITEVQRFAVIVGANAGGKDRALLRYASTDAAALQAVLTRLGGVRSEHRHTLEQPTPQQVRSALERMSQEVAAQRARPEHRNKRFELVFYYSGHSDETGLLVGEAKISYVELKDWIAKVPTDIHVAILDSCASGAFTRLKGGAHRKPFLFANSGNVKGHAFIASSSADEASQESDKIAGSFFTHFLISGMRGAADLDGDKLVTINEAFLFARNETLARTQSTQAGAQHPAYELKLAGTGDLVLTDLRQSRSTLQLGSDLQGRIYVRDAQRRLVAELLKQRGEVSLALAPGTYEITLDEGSKLRVGTVLVSAQGNTPLLRANLVPLAKEKTDGVRGTKPPPPTTPPLVSEPSATPHYLPAHWSLWPGVESPSFKPGHERNAHVSVGLLRSDLHRLDGISSGLGVSVTHLQTQGLQAAIAGNIAYGSLDGAQSAIGFNFAAGRGRGSQLAALVNIANNMQGAQFAGVANIAGEFRGGQFAGGVNIASKIRGVQMGFLNIGGQVKGVQVGLINIADEADVSIGLLPYTKGGVHLELFSSDLALLNMSLRFDAKYNYSFITLGIHPVQEGQVALAGAGAGAKIPVSQRLTISPDLVLRMAMAGKLSFDSSSEARSMLIGSLRLLLNLRLLRRWSLFGGPTWHLRYAVHSQFSPKHSRPGLPWPSAALRADNRLRAWFGFSAGLRF